MGGLIGTATSTKNGLLDPLSFVNSVSMSLWNNSATNHLYRICKLSSPAFVEIYAVPNGTQGVEYYQRTDAYIVDGGVAIKSINGKNTFLEFYKDSSYFYIRNISGIYSRGVCKIATTSSDIYAYNDVTNTVNVDTLTKIGFL